MSTNDTPCCTPGSGCCAGKTVNRREFIKTAAAMGAAGALGLEALTPTARATTPEIDEALAAWKKSLWDAGTTRVYRGDELKHIGMPMGGFGAGQVYVQGHGGLGPWQIVNNFNGNAHAFGGFFAVRTQDASGNVAAKMLQTGGVQGCPGVDSIDFSGEYPFAWLNYNDAALPVSVKLEAYSPLIPLNSKDSGLPAVVFGFDVENTSDRTLDVSILGSAPNLAGWDGYERLDELTHEEFSGNRASVQSEDGRTTIVLDLPADGRGHALSERRELYTNSHPVARHLRMCENVSLHYSDPLKFELEGRPAVYWLGSLSAKDGGAQVLSAIEEAQKGAVLILSGGAASLVGVSAEGRRKAADVDVFDDFESGTFAKWTVGGNCFGDAPVEGTLPNQQKVVGFEGKALINTYFNGDDSTGRAMSAPFTLKRRFVHVLVGGGNWPGQACINLRAGDAILESATGENSETLRAVRWDVSEHIGKQVQFEIVDERKGGWGHVLVDRITLSDSPASPFLDEKVPKALRKAMPFTWTGRSFADGEKSLDSKSPLLVAAEVNGSAKGYWSFKRIRPKRRAEVLLSSEDGKPLVIAGKLGDGHIVVCLGEIESWFSNVGKKRIAGNLLALATGLTYENLTSPSISSPVYGSMALTTTGVSATGRGWVALDDLWQDFVHDGRLDGRSEHAPEGQSVGGALAASAMLRPGEKVRLNLVLSWHFPNRTRDQRYWWLLEPVRLDFRLGNMYNNWFSDAKSVGAYVSENLERLERDTHQFHDTLYDSTLPRWLMDCVSANISIARSPIYIWLEDGTVGGFEGSDACCPLNCTHVYNYAMSTAYLFPDLERRIREIDLLVQMHPDEHYIPHRTLVPLSEPRLKKEIGGPHHPALDGELGTILKAYREWRLQGDVAWLERLWPRIKLLMEYIQREHDPDGDGVIQGEQPNTYDTHLYGSNTFIGTLYLAALRACTEMARLFRDEPFATACQQRFELGKTNYDRICWNGEYYINVFDAPGVQADVYNQNNCYGPGCFTDQLLGQWWAHILQLGHVLPPERVKQTLQSIYTYNWRADLSDHVHHQRVFAEGNEKGLLTGTWPKGGRPERPILYCDEVWTGLEYHVAATMLYEGMTEEAMCIIRGARDRYTGNQRNPWSEIECGGHYARAMSSYALLIAAAGLDYHAGMRALRFAPTIMPDRFMGFFMASKGWGSLEQDRFGRHQRNMVIAKYGEIELDRLQVALPAGVTAPSVEVAIGRVPVRPAMSEENGELLLRFPGGITVSAGESLVLNIRW